jgi:hypothetical protein
MPGPFLAAPVELMPLYRGSRSSSVGGQNGHMSSADIALPLRTRLAGQTGLGYDSKGFGRFWPEFRVLLYLPCSIAIQETARCGVWR